MKTCPSCGGVIGQDCFNPDECAYITMQQEAQQKHDQEQQIDHLEQRLQAIEQRLERIEGFLVL